VNFAAITLCDASERVFIVVVYFVIDTVRKLLDTPSYFMYIVWLCTTAYDALCKTYISLFMLLLFPSRTALGPTQPPFQWVPEFLSLGVKRPGREADHLPPSTAEVKSVWSYTSTPPIRLHGVVLS
jgi:hypothetical protein